MIIAFIGLCLVLAMTPGPDTFLVLRFSLQDSRAGLAAAAGSALGSMVWAFAIAAGLASLLEESATAYRIVKIAGGLYLIYLGLRVLLRRRETMLELVARPLECARQHVVGVSLHPGEDLGRRGDLVHRQGELHPRRQRRPSVRRRRGVRGREPGGRSSRGRSWSRFSFGSRVESSRGSGRGR